MQEFAERTEKEQPVDDLLKLAMEMVPFFLSHNAEPDACDLLLELEQLDQLPGFLDVNTYSRVCLYLVSCASYVAAPDDVKCYKVAHSVYRKYEKWPESLSIAMKLNDKEMMQEDFSSCTDPFVKFCIPALFIL